MILIVVSGRNYSGCLDSPRRVTPIGVSLSHEVGREAVGFSLQFALMEPCVLRQFSVSGAGGSLVCSINVYFYISASRAARFS